MWTCKAWGCIAVGRFTRTLPARIQFQIFLENWWYVTRWRRSDSTKMRANDCTSKGETKCEWGTGGNGCPWLQRTQERDGDTDSKSPWDKAAWDKPNIPCSNSAAAVRLEDYCILLIAAGFQTQPFLIKLNHSGVGKMVWIIWKKWEENGQKKNYFGRQYEQEFV